jgi:hypothetical protein
VLAETAGDWHNLAAMNRSTSLMRITATAVMAAFLIAIAASVAPTLHDSLHGNSGSAHICAVTLLAAGSVEISGASPLTLVPDAAPETLAQSDRVLRLAQALLFTRLEHAPPSFS